MAWGDLEHTDPVAHGALRLEPLPRVTSVVVSVAYTPVGRVTVLSGGVAERFAELDAVGVGAVVLAGVAAYGPVADTTLLEGGVPAWGRMQLADTGLGAGVEMEMVGLEELALRLHGGVESGFEELGLVIALESVVPGLSSLAEPPLDLDVSGDVGFFDRVAWMETGLDVAAPVFLGASTERTELSLQVPAFGLAPAAKTELFVAAPAFSSMSGVENLEIDALLLPCRLWRGSPAGRLRAAVRDAAARGDVEAEQQFTAAYWRVVNQVLERRRLFGQRGSARRKAPFQE